MQILGRSLWISFLSACWFLISAVSPSATDANVEELADSMDPMWCMEKCLRNEGKSAIEKCRWRCANTSAQPKNTIDCMAIYKQCLNTCRSNKGCKRSCKDRLMNCS